MSPQVRKIMQGVRNLHSETSALVIMKQRALEALRSVEDESLTAPIRLALEKAIHEYFNQKFEAIRLVIAWLEKIDVFGEEEGDSSEK